jgi:hypothetical protein
MIQIGVYTAGEESDQHVIHVAPWVSRTTTIHKVPTRSKLELCSRNEVLAPNDRLTRPSSWCLILPPPNHLEAGREWFDKVVTGLLGLPSLINTTCGQSKSKLVHRGKNDMILNRHMWGLLPLNLRIATTLSCLPRPVTTTYMNINITYTHHNHHILLVHGKRSYIRVGPTTRLYR